jgi:hypothetical protein
MNDQPCLGVACRYGHAVAGSSTFPVLSRVLDRSDKQDAVSGLKKETAPARGELEPVLGHDPGWAKGVAEVEFDQVR